jgi:hypothetical protein
MNAREESRAAFLALRETLPAALAGWTGKAWRLIGQDHNVDYYMRLAPAGGGLPLDIGAEHGKGRIRVGCGSVPDRDGRAVWWQDVAPWVPGSGREAPPAMTASLDKSAERIAGDISRRMLPAMERAAPWFQARMESVQAASDQYDSALALLRSMGATIHDTGRGRESRSAYFTTARGGTVRVTVREYGTVEVREDFPPGEALESVLRVILASR